MKNHLQAIWADVRREPSFYIVFYGSQAVCAALVGYLLAVSP